MTAQFTCCIKCRRHHFRQVMSLTLLIFFFYTIRCRYFSIECNFKTSSPVARHASSIYRELVAMTQTNACRNCSPPVVQFGSTSKPFLLSIRPSQYLSSFILFLFLNFSLSLRPSFIVSYFITIISSSTSFL